jgi:TetR/AcrR family transcriptional regulator
MPRPHSIKRKGDEKMISRFMALEPEKRERIINAALREFASKGYKNASTNEIVKEANISKGLLFHYFTNKRDLFFYLYDYSLELFLNEFYGKMNLDETDFIKRWRQIALLKIELIKKHPDIYDFVLTCTVDDSAEIKQELESKNKNALGDGYKRLLVNIDTSSFREDLDIKRASDIIIWAIQGFGNRELDRIKGDRSYRAHFDLAAIMADFDEYLDLLKRAFYTATVI